MQTISVQQIDALLPQTQCGLCGYAGCLPYAHAIAEQQATIHLCVPGGQSVCDALATLTQQPHQPVTPSKWPTDPHTQRPVEVKARIIEDLCIGCTKCIAACPVDAIIGSNKKLHRVIDSWCTGCELCIAPCPVDCIELITVNETYSVAERTTRQNTLKARFFRRLEREHIAAYNPQLYRGPTLSASAIHSPPQDTVSVNTQAVFTPNTLVDNATAVIELASLRTRLKKLRKQYAAQPQTHLQAEIDTVEQQIANMTTLQPHISP